MFSVTFPAITAWLREALVSLFACTDIDSRRSLSKVENVTAVPGCTGLYRLDRRYVEAREAHNPLCMVVEDYDRAGVRGSTLG